MLIMDSVIDWDSVSKKEARGNDNLDLGEIQDVLDDSVIVQKGLLDKEKYQFPKSLVKGFDGNVLTINVSENDFPYSYDENGQETGKVEYNVRVVFKGDKLRLESKNQSNGRQWTRRWVATEEFFKETTIGDPIAVIRDPEAVSNRGFLYNFLPSRNTAFGSAFLKYTSEKLTSRKVSIEDTNDEN